MKSALDLALALATKADHDLRAAEIGLEHDAPLDTVAFHLQQTVEKFLKAFLQSREVDFPRTHDVLALLDLAAALDVSLEAFREGFLGMASYAVDMRYDVDLNPDRAEILTAIRSAREFRHRIRSLLPPGPQPSVDSP